MFLTVFLCLIDGELMIFDDCCVMLTTKDCCLMVLTGVDIKASDVTGDGDGGTPPARRPQGSCRYSFGR